MDTAKIQQQKEQANEILNQIGGYRKVNAMIGITNLFCFENGMGFKILCRGAKANYVKIEINSLDLYDVTFTKIHGASHKVKAERKNVYCDVLKSVIEEETGLRLSLF